MIPENCHCGWRLPSLVRIGKMVIERSTGASSGAKVEAEVQFICPVCDCTYAVDRELVIVARDVGPTKGVAKA